VRFRAISIGDFNALAAGSIAWQRTNPRTVGPVFENGDAFSAQWRVELVKTSQKSGALQRGFRIGKLGFGLVGSYLGYQAQNLLLSESGKAQRRARFQQQASKQVRGELGALKGAAMKLGQLLSMQSG